MPRISCIVFAAKRLRPELVAGKRILDVGACDFNGSIRPLLESYKPLNYLGVDMVGGPSVDRIVNADELTDVFGEDCFDIVIAIEMMEHTRNWRRSLSNLKRVCKPAGLLLITAPACGYPYHGYPTDFWRYEENDFQKLLADFEDVETERDAGGPGSFVCARKPINFRECDLSDYTLYSVVTDRRETDLCEAHFRMSYFRKLRIKMILREGAHALFLKLGRVITSVFAIRQNR